ncbi:MAG: TauD/TfdA family dioxygenase, partial [Xanthobacteraceae bacterium]|nr:TauD/TfdA family dioxygenase [Xanthobacteraceae bacterium]
PLETRPLHPTLACQVLGLRLWEAPSAEVIAELRELYSRYGVLVFRRQALSEAELAGFCALFGELEQTVRSDWASPTVPEVTVLSNLKDGLGRPIGGLGDGELQWHSDQSYMLRPATGAALYALELPPAGGETFWVDLRAGYAALPRRLRSAITGKRGVFDYAKRLAGYGRENDQNISDEARRQTPPVTHALVRRHPETGDPSLYLDSTTTVGIDYMDTATGLALLDEVYDAATRDEFVYAHCWQVGDLVLWDNGFTMHRRTAFDPGDRRLMKRVTMRLDKYRHVLPDGALAQSEVGMPI